MHTDIFQSAHCPSLGRLDPLDKYELHSPSNVHIYNRTNEYYSTVVSVICHLLWDLCTNCARENDCIHTHTALMATGEYSDTHSLTSHNNPPTPPYLYTCISLQHLSYHFRVHISSLLTIQTACHSHVTLE